MRPSRLPLAVSALSALLLFLTSSAEALTFNNWSSNGPTPTRESVRAIAIAPTAGTSTVYAGTDGGGAYSMAVTGSSWTTANKGLYNRRVRSVVAKPAPSQQELFAATAAGVFKSPDGGVNWNAASTGLTTLDVQRLAIDPNDSATIYAATTGGGVFKSTDSATNWSAVNSGLTNLDVRAFCLDSTTSPSTIYAATAGGVFKSADGGASWSATSTGLTDLNVTALAYAGTSPSATIFAGTAGGGVFVSSDGGTNWGTSNSGLLNTAVRALKIDPTTPNTAYAGTAGGLFRRSYDTVAFTWGAWSQTGAIDITNTSIRAIGIDPSGPATLFAATDAGLFRSTNAGTNWSAVNTGLLQGRAMVVKPGDPTRLVTAFSGGGLFRSTDRGTSWAEPATIPANSFTTSLLHDPYTLGVVYAGSGAGVFRSADDGDTWSDITGDLGVTDVHALAIDPTAPHTLYAGTGNSVFSWDGNTTTPAWIAYNSASLGNKDVLSLAFNGSSLFAGTNGGGVYRSDSGGSWSQQINGLSGTIVNALAVGAGTVYAGTNAGVHKTTSNGATWDAINSGITTLNILSLTVNATTSDAPSAATLSTLAAGTSGGGVFISNNDGVSWSAVNTRLTDLKVNGIAADSGWPQYLHAATSTKAFSLKMSPVIRILPASGTNYGNANIISAPSSQTYTLTNNGPLALVISDVSAGSLSPTGTTATITAGTCPTVPLAADSASMVTLAPGTSCTLLFNFTPSAVGPGSAVISFTSSDVSSPVTAVTLNWTGIDPPPTSSITAPLAGTTIRTPTGYAISGSASDVGSGLLRVEVSTDGVNWSSAVGTTSWTFSWQPVLDAAYTIRSRAIDMNNNVQTTPASVSINVDNTAPTAVISSPLNNASVRGTTVTVTGTAADPTSAGSGIQQVDVSTDGGTTWLPASGTTTWTFSWTLPADGMYSLQARATDYAGNQGSSTTVSVRVDKTAPSVAITAPTSGTTLPTGTSYTITGTATDGGSGVTLVEISLDNGGTWLTATYDAVGSSWSYPWTLPVNNTYQILARATDVAGNTATTSAITAIISNPLPSATIVSPAAGAFVNGLSLAISGTALAGNPVLGLSRVEISIDGGTTWQAAGGTTTWTYTAALPQHPSGYVPAFAIKARAIDGIGNVQTPSTDIAITVDNESPTSAIASPVTGSYLRGGSATIQGTASDVGLGVQRVEISTDGGTTWSTATGTASWSYSWTLPADGVYVIMSRAVDSIVGNVQNPPASISVTVDNTAPHTTLTLTPANPSNTATPAFGFSADESATFRCSVDNGTEFACTSPLTLSALLGGNHSFKVYAVDLAGNVDPAPPTYAWTIDLVTPAVSSTLPAAGATRVSVSLTQVTATFTKDVNPLTVTTASFYLDNGATGTVTYNSATRTAIFTPSAPLRYSTTYTATISTAVADAAGNTLAANVVWTFSTDPDGDITMDGKVDLSDALLALQTAVGIRTVTAQARLHGDVGPLSGGRPLPDGFIDGRDAMVILGKTIGILNW
ncbi:MAG: hypothetical protein GJT30_04750 [Geobacter sp.]|nr:hypothetical protein [Geobacter sp.]